MKYIVHQKDPINGWEEVESYSDYKEVTNEHDRSFFEWLLVMGESVVKQGDTMWEIRYVV